MIWSQAIIDGVILSIVLGGWVLVILYINPRLELKSYPPEIVKQVPKQTIEEKRQFKQLAVPVLLLIILYLLFSVSRTYHMKGSWMIRFFHLFTVCMIWNVIDLIFLDWLIFCHITPSFIIIPGTEHNPAYKDYFFHVKGFLRGSISSTIVAICLATLSILVHIIRHV